jgi:concanavalin A-like lectin/glucanase superfamily protein/IPT/TIG domain-containing protein
MKNRWNVWILPVFFLSGTVLSAETTIDLGDIVGGGDGSGNGTPGSGIDATNGNRVPPLVYGGDHHGAGGHFQPMNGAIDALFIPKGPTQISTTGLSFVFPQTSGDSWDVLRDGVCTLEADGTVRPLFLANGSVATTGVGLHANLGVTFDLDVLRSRLGLACPSMRFTAIAGGRLGSMTPVGWVVLDGLQKSSQNLRQGTPIDIPIGAARFLTLASTDGDGTYGNDKAYFAEAKVIIEEPPPSPSGNFALQFYGTRKAVQFPNVMAVAGQAFTFEAWVQPGTAPLTASVFQHRANYRDKSLSIYTKESGILNIQLFMVDKIDGGASPERRATASISYQPCDWIHVAGSYDGSFLRVFVNGHEEASEPAPLFDGYLDWTNDWLGTFIGTSLIEAVPPYYRGGIDEVRVWSEARSEAQIAAGMAHTVVGPEPGLLGAWNLDEADGQTVHDASGGHFDGHLGMVPDADDLDPTWVQSTSPIEYIEVSGITPKPCPTAGADLIITGNRFMTAEDTTIMLDGAVISPVSLGDNQIVIHAPPHTDGQVNLEIKNQVGRTTATVVYRSEFIRGDVSGRGRENIDLTDGINILSYLFLGGSAGNCLEALDVTDNGEVDLTDAIALFGYLFQGGIRPPEPFLKSGSDPTPDTLFCGR